MTFARYLVFACFAGLPLVAMADAQPQERVKAEVKTEKTQDKSAAKPKEQSAPKTPKNNTPKDLDAFFKEGQEQVKEGPTCRKPPVPVA